MKELQKMGKTVLFYAAVKDVSLFKTQMFYQNTRETLEKIGLNVIMTNRISDALTQKYDGILCFFFKKGVVPAFFAKLRGKKVFFTGGLDDLEKSIVSSQRYYMQVIVFKLCRFLANYCLIESSSDIKNINRISFIKNHKNIFYSPQAIDTGKYNCALSEKEHLFSTICWQGNITNCQRKGVDKSLLLFKEFRAAESFKNYKFIIMGREGAGTPYLRKLIEDYNLNDCVTLTGEVTEKEKLDLLKRSRYFFQLSQYEGFGLAALEAASSRCIPIHSAKGGLCDTLADDGVVVDIKDNQSIIDNKQGYIDKLLSITNNDVEKMHSRIVSSFDSKVRLQNFEKTIGRTLNS